MGNSKKITVPTKRKASKKSKCTSSSDQKENDDGLAMSRQLLLKKTNALARRQTRLSSKPKRICSNGKALPSLKELKKKYEDSDDDDNDHQTPETPTPKLTSITSTPTTPTSIKYISPTTISEITKKILESIEKQKLPAPSEVLEANLLLRTKSPTPAPVIPPKKRKKTEVPYIVGCKDRPKLNSKLQTNFCKGDYDYGVAALDEDPEDQISTKRAKKSRITNYSKSIFNVHSDEIAEKLAKDDAEVLSDASSDSNKTIMYDPTVFRSPRLHSFSPLPSTSTDSETIKKNDELFNESLKEIEIAEESLPKIKDDVQITTERTLEVEDDMLFKLTSIKNNDDVEIVDISCDTIVIEDICEITVGKQNTSNAADTGAIEIIETVELEVAKPKEDIIIHNIPIDDDCMIVSSSKIINTHNKPKLDEPIVIDDEYSNINMDFDSSRNEPCEIIDVDNIIAVNKSILDKWKKDRAIKLKKSNTSLQGPPTMTMIPTSDIPSTTLQPEVTSSSTLQTTMTTNPNNDLNITNRDRATNSLDQTQPISINKNIFTYGSALDGSLVQRQNNSNSGPNPLILENTIDTICRSMATRFNSAYLSSTSNYLRETTTLKRPVSNTLQTVDQELLEELNNSSSPARNIGDCPICLDNLNTSHGIASTICGHVFCLTCIKASVKTNGKKCPTCRKPLRGAGGGYHLLYL